LIGYEDLEKLSNRVTPVKTGVQNVLKRLDSGFRRNDGKKLMQEAHLLDRSAFFCENLRPN